MKHFHLIDREIDVAPLLAQIDAHPELWDRHSIRKTAPGTPHSEMSDIWVRYNDVAPFEASGDYSNFNDAHIPVWYPAWDLLPALKPIVFDLVSQVQGEMIGGILITRIPPGGKIAPHIDRSWHVSYFEKFYLSLKSEAGAVFGCDCAGFREELSPNPGEMWLFDNRKLHWVENNSAADRLTLITCIRTAKFGRMQ